MNDQASMLDDRAEDDVEGQKAAWRPLGSLAGDLMARAMARRSNDWPDDASRVAPMAWAAE